MRAHDRPIRTVARRALALLGCALLAAAPARAENTVAATIYAEARESFMLGDFATLDRENNRLRQGVHLEEDASSQLEYFRLGMTSAIGTKVKRQEPYLRELEALTLQFAERNPKSSLAHVLYANVLVQHGWSYRGNGYMQDVPEAARKEFVAYLTRAANYLRQHADVALTDSYAHKILIDIGKSLGWKPEQLRAVAEAGLKRNPYDLDLYFDLVGTLVPKWGGDPKTLDKYIREATEQTRAQFGSGMYARLYSAAAQDEYGPRLFLDSHADWPTMKKSYEDMLARYPNSPERRNRFAHMACVAGDQPTLRALLEELGPKVDAKFWGRNGGRTLEGCRRIASEV